MARGKKRVSGFVGLKWDLLNSLAFKTLTPSASKALPYFLGKVKLPFNDPGLYYSVFEFSYSEARKLGFATATWSRAIRELISKGFIDPVAKGGLRGDGKSCNKYKLSPRWEKFGTPEYIENKWECFQPRIA